MADTYNGWSNYETWNWKLWIDNDQGCQEYWQNAATEAYRDAEADSVYSRKERAALDLSKMLQAEAEENAPEVTGPYADLINAALGAIDWYEIAESMIGDVSDDVDAEEKESAGDEVE